MRIAKPSSLICQLAIVGAFAWSLGGAFATIQAAEAVDLVAAATAAKSEFVPLTKEKVASAKKTLATSIATLEKHLYGAGKANGEAWKKYLDWPTLTAIAASDTPPKADDLSIVMAKLASNKAGIEKAPYQAVRKNLATYVGLLQVSTDEKLSETYAAKLDALIKLLGDYSTAPTTDNALAIGQILSWLDAAGQAPQLTSTIHSQLSGDNLLASVSHRFAAAGFEEPVDRTTPVRDVILGTNIVGTARLQGQTRLEFVPSETSARMAIHLEGTAASTNVGTNGPVTLYSNGLTNVKASTYLTMTDAGLSYELANACCTTSTTFTGLCAKCNLIAKIGWKQAYKKKSQGEAIASSHAEVRIEQQMNQQAAEAVTENNTKFIDRLRKPLQRRGGFPKSLVFSTVKERAFAKIKQAGKTQLGAPANAPAMEGEFDVAVQAHETVVTNFGQAVLGGVTLTDEMLVDILVNELQSEVPEELQITDDKDPWSITFAEEVPVRATFSTEALKLAIRGTRFTRGDQRFSEPIEISAIYKVERNGDGTKLTRQGDVEVTFLARERLGPTQIGFKTFLRRKFEAMFKPEFASEGIALKGRWEKAGKLSLKQLTMNNGWAVLGWNLQADEKKAEDTATPTSTSAEADSAEAASTEAPAAEQPAPSAEVAAS